MREIAQALPNIEVRGGEPMSLHTSLRIGGTVRAMVFPKTEGELIESGRALRRMGISPLLIGAGTNLLVSDAALDIVVIRTVPGVGELKILGERSDRLVFASCGVTLPRLSAFARDNGLGGAEFMHGIPGSVGGAVCMNAGAYGSEMSDIVRLVTAQSEDGKVFDTAGQDCGFSYRHSGYADDNSVVLSVVIELIDKEPDDIRRDMQKYDELRRAKQPLELPSAGSAFKRPRSKDGEPLYAAALIEECGLKGYSVGGAAVSDKHAGFVVNRGGASFDDMLRLMGHIKNEVFRQSGVEIEPEIKIIGDDGKWMFL